MPVQHQNYDYCYEKKSKPVFAPSDLGRIVGEDIKAKVEAVHTFEDFVYHLKKNGGHVAALHAHRPHNHFARIDFARFFYTIARNRVKRAISSLGINRAEHYAKWSTVKNPYNDPSYALPYGFVQSPILATLVLMKSEVGDRLRVLHAAGTVTVSVYVDDISLSSDDPEALEAAYAGLLGILNGAQFILSEHKLRRPSAAIDLFNCDLTSGRTAVRAERVAEFAAVDHSEASIEQFARYTLKVEEGNV
jgi:Reverse transcriptase (RNA-dependent DNA polymerase)